MHCRCHPDWINTVYSTGTMYRVVAWCSITGTSCSSSLIQVVSSSSASSSLSSSKMPSSGSRRHRKQSSAAANQFTSAPYASLAHRVREDHVEVAEKTNTTMVYNRYVHGKQPYMLEFQLCWSSSYAGAGVRALLEFQLCWSSSFAGVWALLEFELCWSSGVAGVPAAGVPAHLLEFQEWASTGVAGHLLDFQQHTSAGAPAYRFQPCFLTVFPDLTLLLLLLLI